MQNIKRASEEMAHDMHDAAMGWALPRWCWPAPAMWFTSTPLRWRKHTW